MKVTSLTGNRIRSSAIRDRSLPGQLPDSAGSVHALLTLTAWGAHAEALQTGSRNRRTTMKTIAIALALSLSLAACTTDDLQDTDTSTSEVSSGFPEGNELGVATPDGNAENALVWAEELPEGTVIHRVD